MYILAYESNVYRPIAFKKGSANVVDEELTADPYPTWQKLEEMVAKGKVKNIGISKLSSRIFNILSLAYFLPSSFNIRRIKNLTANPLKIKPAVNQVELNIFNPQPELLQARLSFDTLSAL